MKPLSALLSVVSVCAVCLGADVRSGLLPRSTPETQGVSSAAVLAFVEAADRHIDSMNSFMLVRHGHVVAEGWWTPYDAETPHMLYSLSKSFTSTAVGLAIAEGKLSLDDEVLKFFPEDAPARAERQPQGDAHQRSAAHVHRASERAVAWRSGEAWTKTFLAHPVPYKPGTHFLYNTSATYMLSAIAPEGDGDDRARLSAAAAVRAAGHREPDLGNQPAGHHARRLRPEHPHRGHRPVWPALPAERQVAGEASSCPRRGSTPRPRGRPPTAAIPKATGIRATAISSGGAGTACTGATAPSASTASSCPNRTR